MSSKPPPPRTKSGEHPSISAYRAKLDSIEEHTLPFIEEKIREGEAKVAEMRSLTPPADNLLAPDELIAAIAAMFEAIKNR